jgi:hypothetical protein
VKSRALLRLSIPLLSSWIALPAASQLLGDNLIGTNIGTVNYWSVEHQFIDQMKVSEPWRVQSSTQWNTGEAPDLDSNGWVRSIPPNREIGSLMLRGKGGRWPRDSAGYPITDWVVTYDGVGTFRVEGGSGCQIMDPTPGRFVIGGCTPSDHGFHFVISSVQAGDHARNIRIVPPEYEHEDTNFDKVFFPYFIDELKKYTGPLRMLNFMRTNANDQVSSWATAPRPTDAKQSSVKGAAVWYAVALANEVSQHLWLNVPYLATDDWVTEAALVIDTYLDPSLKVIVEYANEAWNALYPVNAYSQQKAIEDGICTVEDAPYACGLQWYAKRSNEIHDIFESQMGDDRVIRVVAGQSAVPWTATQILEFDNTYQKTEVYAIAPYFCRPMGTEEYPNATEPEYDEIDELFAYCKDVHVQYHVFKDIDENKALVDSYGQGIELWAYEGGQHLVGVGDLQLDPTLTALFTSANRDSGIEEIYRKYFRGVFDRGIEVFTNYTTVTPYDQWGSWGLREFDDQTRVDSPKYDAVMCMLEDGDTDGDAIPDCIDDPWISALAPSARIGLALLIALGGIARIARGRKGEDRNSERDRAQRTPLE